MKPPTREMTNRPPGAPIVRPRTAVRSLAYLGWLCALWVSHVDAQPRSAPSGHVDRAVLPDDVLPLRYDIEFQPDASKLSFRASVQVRIEVKRPTSTIRLNAVDLAVDHAALAGQREAPRISEDSEEQQLTLALGAALKPGEYTLSIDYHGRIYQHSTGLFALDYDTPNGTRRSLYTHFEPAEARRFVPCWDQPDRKAVFALTAIVPAGLMAVSNMPIASTRALSDRLQRVTFAPTPKMSSYLLFFSLGDFERTQRRVAGVDVGVVVRRGDSANAAFALDAATQMLPYYNDYLGTHYPLAKLDLIAAPARDYGAMENWGAILFSDRDLLLDPRVSTTSDRQRVYEVIADEMAELWFGGLVTMAWWDDLWLNEGFATWMAHKAIDRFHPEWKVWLQREPDLRAAMIDDASAGTHPIVAPIRDVHEAESAFDAITVLKGAAVIRMVEAYVGEGVFRDGVRAYMGSYAHANTVSGDLWGELQAVSSVPLREIAKDFTLQAGVPLIDVTQGDGYIALSVDGYWTDPSSRAPASWRVPVLAATAGGEIRRTIVTAQEAVRIHAGAMRTEAPLINAGQTGYYVVRYEPTMFRELRDRFPKLRAEDQVGLLADTWALASAGYSSMASVLELVGALPADADPSVWAFVCYRLTELGRRYGEAEAARAYRRWVRSELTPVRARVGWDPRPGESDSTATLRAKVLQALAEADDESVLAEARRRFQRFSADPRALSGESRSAVLNVVALHADSALWERLHVLARDARSELEQDQLYEMLGNARDPALAQRALDLAVSGEPPGTTAPTIVKTVARLHPGSTFDFVISHWDRIAPLLPSRSRGRFAPSIAGGSDDPDTATRLADFSKRAVSACNPADVRQAIARIRYLSSIKQQRLAEVDRWLAEHSS
jgi:aminopeptidase N